MAEVTWSREALANLAGIRAYIRAFDPVAATRLARRLLDAGDGLADFPARGRLTADGCRMLATIRPYIIFYELHDGDVLILSIRHGAQLRDG